MKTDDLANTIDTLAKGIAGLNPDIAEMQVQLKRASEDRELENKSLGFFQTAKSNALKASRHLADVARKVNKALTNKQGDRHEDEDRRDQDRGDKEAGPG